MRPTMGIVTNNKAHAQASDDFDLSFNDGHKVKVQFNCEVLSGCEFKCKGCFVNKLGSNVGSFDKLNNAIDLFKNNGYHVSTINIGPTDLFGNNNIISLLEDEVFRECLSKVTTIQFVTTLENVDLQVIDKLNSIKKRDGFMYDCNIQLQPPVNWADIKDKMSALDLFWDDLNYYFVYNMGNDDEYNEQVLDMSRVTDKVFDSILTLNPSFFRAQKSKVHKHLIDKWKKYDFSDDLYPKTIIDQAQGGSLELNYTYCNDRFFWTPFVYDIVLIGTDEFEVKDPTDLNSWEEPKTNMFTKQLMYDTENCSGCVNQMTCIDKGVLSYMQHHALTACVFPGVVADN
tara:strand:+ start:2493 stop:3521 length:1029 start_codon:yes stop_codon:yes gene_type:complete